MGIITSDIVKKVALLARVRLEGDELTQIATQLDAILQHVHQLQSVPTDHIEPTSHVLPLSNVLRKDEPRPCLPQEAVIALAPSANASFVRVPKVIDVS